MWYGEIPVTHHRMKYTCWRACYVRDASGAIYVVMMFGVHQNLKNLCMEA